MNRVFKSGKNMVSHLCAWILPAVGICTTNAEDWPVFQHDNRRSGATSEQLPVAHLVEAWVHQSPQPPSPAWAGPAKWDAYAGIRGLKSMRNYDPVFHVVAADGLLWFGSTSDNSVHCLEARSGKERWVFTTDGAVRIAPTFANGRLYFGSDDGHAYCLNAETGAPFWKYSPSPRDRLILHDGKFIPFWPCRTGVLVEGNTAYFATGMLPWKESYLCAVDALTGLPAGPGRFVRRIDGVTMEGALLASSERLISPQGRVPPLLFDRRDGGPLGSLEGGGGCFVLLTEDEHVLHGPGNKTGWINESRETDRAKIATFNGANALVVQGDLAFILTDSLLAAIHRKTREELWQRTSDNPCALILAGNTLFTGGPDRVTAYRADDGSELWTGTVAGRAYSLAVADGGLFVSTDQGAIHCFRLPNTFYGIGAYHDDNEYYRLRGSIREVRVYQRALTSEEAARHAAENQIVIPKPLELAAGPMIEFEGPDRAIVWWQTSTAKPSILEWGLKDGPARRVVDETGKVEHRAVLTGLRPDRTYLCAIKVDAEGKEGTTAPFECDTFFNYNPAEFPDLPSPYGTGSAADRWRDAASEILESSDVDRGICLVVGSGRGELAYELAKQSRLRVVGLETDPSAVHEARRLLLEAGVYGSRVTIHSVATYQRLPFTEMVANLIVAGRGTDETAFPVFAGTAARYLRPFGGVALFDLSSSPPEVRENWLRDARANPEWTGEIRGHWAKLTRGVLPGTGAWSHQYGNSGNAAYAGETLQGASSTTDLDVQWLGRPGPRAQPDRNGRKPSPLSTQGRLFVQGLHRIVALDAYNGSILWALEIPPLQRFNIPRDSSNWCADDDFLYAAIADRCWRLDAGNGRLSKSYPVVPGARPMGAYDWGFLAVQGDTVLGSAVSKGTAYIEYWGGPDAGWYDAVSGPATFKVCAENLFGLDRDTGRTRWVYSRGRIIHSTVCAASKRVYFIESRHPKVVEAESDRIGSPELWAELHLVALDLRNGALLWEKPIQPEPGIVVFNLAHGSDRLVLVSSGNQNYHVYAYSDGGGDLLWENHFPWPKDNHGGHMARPAIVSERVYVRPRVLDLKSGAFRDEQMPVGGCGTYAATSNALFFRNSNVSVWNTATGNTTAWERLRPDCWLSTIPASGLLLSPEAGGGCSCGSWMETSLAFIPVTARANGTP